jgi:hypothetical protein
MLMREERVPSVEGQKESDQLSVISKQWQVASGVWQKKVISDQVISDQKVKGDEGK